MHSSESAAFDHSAFLSICSGNFFGPRSSFSSFFPEKEGFFLIYCTKGSFGLTFGKQEHSLSLYTGCLAFLFSDSPILLSGTPDSSSFYCCQLCGSRLPSYYSLLGNTVFSPADLSLETEILSLFGELEPLCGQLSPPLALRADRLLTELFTSLVLSRCQNKNAFPALPRHVSQLKEWCDTCYSEDFSLEVLAEQFEVSKYRLCRDFSACLHLPPLQYLNRQRILAARQLLLSTDDCVYQVGNAVGIENTNHFINLFKKYTGTTPKEFRHTSSPR